VPNQETFFGRIYISFYILQSIATLIYKLKICQNFYQFLPLEFQHF
jgi:hypothetical protein